MVGKLGDLYIVATPIGNLGDMVPRGLEVLQRADWVAAEDTRHSGRLLSHFGIDTPMLTYHDHGDARQLQRIIDILMTGETVALIADAGTPLISDPGYRLVREARLRKVAVVPIPGSCAAVAALSAAGIPSNRFAFEGFLPAKESQRKKALQGLERETRTLIFYEAPHRVLDTLRDMGQIFGGAREAALARELTKTHETFLCGSLEEIASQVASDPNQQRGEIVIILRGAEPVEVSVGEDEQRRLLTILLAELSVKQAAALAARIGGGNKKALYQLAVKMKNSV